MTILVECNIRCRIGPLGVIAQDCVNSSSIATRPCRLIKCATTRDYISPSVIVLAYQMPIHKIKLAHMAPKHMISDRTPPFLTVMSSTCETSLNLTPLYCLVLEWHSQHPLTKWSTPPCYMINTLASSDQHLNTILLTYQL